MKIVTVICWLVAAAALAGLAIWFLTGTVFGFRRDTGAFSWSPGYSIGGWERLTGPYEPVGTYSVGTGGVDSLNVDWVSGDVTIKPHGGNDIMITEFAQRALRDEEKLRFNISGDTLNIKFRENGYIGISPQKKLEVLIPSRLCESMNAFAVDSASGRLYINDIKADRVRTESVSGSIHLENISARAFDVISASGSITITAAQAGDLKIDSVSGSVKLSDSAAGTLNCEAASGSITVSGVFDDAKLETVSGRIAFDNSATTSVLRANTASGSLDLSGSFDKADVESVSGSVSIKSAVVPATIKVETASGGITVAIPDEGAVSVRHSTMSGRFSSDIPVTMQGRDAQFDLSTVSGSIKIVALG